MLIGFGLEGRGASDSGEGDRLVKAGCGRVFLTARNGVFPMGVLEYLRPGDTLVTVELSRIGATLRDLTFAIERLHRAGASLQVLEEPLLDGSQAIQHLPEICAVLAEFVRRSEQKSGRKGHHRYKGRPAVLSAEEQARARKLLDRNSVRQVAAILGVSVPTLYRYFPRRKSRARIRNPAADATPLLVGTDHKE